MGWNQQPSARNVTTQTIAYDATAAIANPFGPQIKQIRLAANSACHYRVFDVGSTSAATAADPFLPANFLEYVTVTPGQKIAAIKAATNGLVTATAGTLWVTEIN